MKERLIFDNQPMKLIKATCLIILFIQGCSLPNEDSAFRDKLQLSTLEGDKVDMDKLENHYLLVNFWATWCRPCIREMPALNELEQALEGQNIEFIFISNEDRGHVSEFLARQELGINSYIMKDAIEVYELLYLPTTFIISPEGEVLKKMEGEQDWTGARMKQEINDLIRD